MLRTRLLASILLAGCAPFARAQRQTIDLDQGWRFHRGEAAVGAPTADWSIVRIPHTWNAGTNYWRGDGWYRRDIDVPDSWRGRRVFLQFDAVSRLADVYWNGTLLGEHRGAFTAFVFELTPWLRYGAQNELRVRANNGYNPKIAPLSGDFNVDGGIYRSVRLIVTGDVCISPLDHGSNGLYISVIQASAERAGIRATVMLANSGPRDQPIQIQTTVLSADGKCVASARGEATVAGGARAQAASILLGWRQPHLWDGRADPYIYRVCVEILRQGQTLDQVETTMGVRSVAIDANGFQLNGHPYPIHGICRHQDFKDRGWALEPEDEVRDLELVVDLGATAVRNAHYPQSRHWHDLADAAGLLLWDEVPFVNELPRGDGPAAVADRAAFAANLEEQEREMILQLYNHPSIAFWGLFNELRPGANSRAALPLVQRLNAVAHGLDAARITVGASDHFGLPTNAVPDALAYNEYPGWYVGKGLPGEMTSLIDSASADRNDGLVALSEYGAGGNPAQHAAGAPSAPSPYRDPFHPIEWQTLMHERDWAQISANPKIWGSFIWVLCDFASDGRNEGGEPGINDKGLVSQDRMQKKDAYYFYQANWSPKAMVHLVDAADMIRRAPNPPVEAYSNCEWVELRINGRSLGRKSPDSVHIVRWSNVPLKRGANQIRVLGGTGRLQDATDSATWILEAAAGTASPLLPPSRYSP